MQRCHCTRSLIVEAKRMFAAGQNTSLTPLLQQHLASVTDHTTHSAAEHDKPPPSKVGVLRLPAGSCKPRSGPLCCAGLRWACPQAQTAVPVSEGLTSCRLPITIPVYKVLVVLCLASPHMCWIQTSHRRWASSVGHCWGSKRRPRYRSNS